MPYAIRDSLSAMRFPILASPRLRFSASIQLGVVFMLIALFLGCDKQEDNPPWIGPARIALVLPQSDSLKDEGQMLHLGALTALDEARDRAQSRKVEMVAYHSPCDPEKAANFARRVAGDATVCAVVGYLCTDALRAAISIYEEHGLALINPTVSAEHIRTMSGRHLFSMLYRDSEQAAFLAAYIKKGLGLTRVAVLRDGSAYGHLLMTSFLAEAERQDLELVAQMAVNSDVTGATQAIQLVKEARPEAIFLAANLNAAGLFLLERHRQQLAGKVLGPDRLADLDIYEMVGKAAEGLLVCQPILLDAENFEEIGFVRRFEMLHKRRPDWIAAAGYDAARLALEVLLGSGPNRGGFLQALQKISGADTSFPTLGGPLFFRQDGTSQRPIFVAEVHGGELRGAKPSSVEFP